LEVFIIITPWVEQSLGNLDPSQIANKLQDWEPGKVNGRCVVGINTLLNKQQW